MLVHTVSQHRTMSSVSVLVHFIIDVIKFMVSVDIPIFIIIKVTKAYPCNNTSVNFHPSRLNHTEFSSLFFKILYPCSFDGHLLWI
jgi:hypothetical protein